MDDVVRLFNFSFLFELVVLITMAQLQPLKALLAESLIDNHADGIGDILNYGHARHSSECEWPSLRAGA